MPERKTLATISVVTDDDTGMYAIGEIDGGFHLSIELREHIAAHGSDDLLRQLAHMTSDVIRATLDLRYGSSQAIAGKANPDMHPEIKTEPSAEDLQARDEMLADPRVRKVGAGIFKADIGLRIAEYGDGTQNMEWDGKDGLVNAKQIKAADVSEAPQIDSGVVIDQGGGDE